MSGIQLSFGNNDIADPGHRKHEGPMGAVQIEDMQQ